MSAMAIRIRLRKKMSIKMRVIMEIPKMTRKAIHVSLNPKYDSNLVVKAIWANVWLVTGKFFSSV